MRPPDSSPSSDRYQREPSARVSEAPVPHIWIPVRRSQLILTVVLFGAAVFLFGLALDLYLIRQQRFQPATAAAILDAFLGLVAAALLYTVLSYDREKRMRVLERLETIDEMNHHIRNALQIIAFNAHARSNEFELIEIRNAVERIQWAVREILPRVEPAFMPFEGKGKAAGEGDGPRAVKE